MHLETYNSKDCFFHIQESHLDQKNDNVKLKTTINVNLKDTNFGKFISMVVFYMYTSIGGVHYEKYNGRIIYYGSNGY